MNNFVSVWVYAGLRVCLFLSLIACLRIFILLSRQNMLTLFCDKNLSRHLVLLYFGNQTFFYIAVKMYQNKQLINHNSKFKVTELKM